MSKQIKTETLREVTTSPDAKVDREACIIRGVRILGPSSLNGRTYIPAAVERAAGMYEAAMVNVDHPRTPGQERSVADRLGWLEGVKHVDGGLTGDLYFLKSDPRADKICEAAERKPELLGLSHNVRAKTSRDGDTTVVEEITQVISVDVVSDPATTKSLFESQGKLMEDNLSVAPDDATPDPSAEIKWGFKSAVNAVLDGDGDKKSKLAQIKSLLDAEEKAEAALTAKPDETPADDGGNGEENPAEESRRGSTVVDVLREEVRQLKDEAAVRTLLEGEGRPQDPILVKALMGLPDQKDRVALVESWPKDSVDRPRSAMPKRQYAVDTPKDAKSFADSVV